jgi:Fur family ferric uptake transcriptional regulator
MAIVWADHVYTSLKVAGFKRSAARDRVIELLGEQRCGVTALEIEEALRATGHPTGRATIYRTLELLVDQGFAERITTGPGQSAFEALHPGGHHHHLVCDQCGRLVAFHDPGLERAIDKLEGRLGVRIESHDVLLRGSCGDCD